MAKIWRVTGMLLLLITAACSTEKSNKTSYLQGLEQQAEKDFLRLQAEGKIEIFDLPGVRSLNTELISEPTIYSAHIDYPYDKYDEYISVLKINYIKIGSTFKFESYEIGDRSNISTSIVAPKKSTIGNLNEKSILVVSLGISFLLISVIAAIMALMTQNLKFKYLWILGCFIGYGRIYAGWTTGIIFFGDSLIQFTIPVFWLMPISLEYFIRASFPVGATLFFWLRFTGGLPIKGEQA